MPKTEMLPETHQLTLRGIRSKRTEMIFPQAGKVGNEILLAIICALVLSQASNVAGNNLGFRYSDLSCSLSTDGRSLYCNGRGIAGLVYINNLPSNLENLYLNNNNITSVQKETFANSRMLRKLYLNDNKILNFQSGTFSTLENLQVLDLSNNDINVFSDNTFSGLLSIVELEANGNPITSPSKKCYSNNFLKARSLRFDSGANIVIYECLPKITSCDKDIGCKHTDFPGSCKAFDQITATLDCTNGGYKGHVYLSSIPDRTKTLILKQNFISSFDKKTFKYLEDLVDLDLSSNDLQTLDTEVLSNLKKLKLLNIAKNPILSSNIENRSECVHGLKAVSIVIDSKTYEWHNCANKNDQALDEDKDNLSKADKSICCSGYYCLLTGILAVILTYIPEQFAPF